MSHDPECLLMDHTICDNVEHELSDDGTDCIVCGTSCICDHLAAARKDERLKVVNTLYAIARGFDCPFDAKQHAIAHLIRDVAFGIDRGDTIDEATLRWIDHKDEP